ncbi:MAG: ATP-binding protein [Bacteroidota bacterium]
MEYVLEELKRIERFKDVPEEQLEWLLGKSDCRSYTEGEYLFKKGDCIDELIVVIKGRFIIRMQQKSQYRILGYIEKHDIAGALPYSRATNATAESTAMDDSMILCLDHDHFPEMIKERHELTTALVHVMSTRIREFTKLQQQNEKIISLGKLSAGLAHELNNPSSAVVRGAHELKKHLSLIPDKFKKVIKIQTDEKTVDAVNELLFNHIKKEKPELTMMQRSDLQYDIEDWFEEHDVEDEDGLSESLAEFDFSIEELDEIASMIREKDLEAVINWIVQNMITDRMVVEIEEASARIGELVGSVKSYTHMDQAPEKQRADIHEGIKNTLIMLNYKIKKSKINVETKFGDLPKPLIYISEMNQVWTNLLDNAIDAMKEEDEKNLLVESMKDDSFIKVLITDSGSGIPEDELNKIFDPFYTTKEVGKGTGIGLDIVQQIVGQHHGSIKVLSSKPGKTVFEVCIPID